MLTKTASPLAPNTQKDSDSLVHGILQKFVRHGSTAGNGFAMNDQQQMDNKSQGCASRTPSEHDKAGMLRGCQNVSKCHDKDHLVSGRDRFCAAPSVAQQPSAQRNEVESTQPTTVRDCCSKSVVELPSAVLDKIKEGMAQLLAEYTWPWYEQNVHLFRSLYNVHLVNDVAFAHDEIRRA